jgi:cytochrome b6-f complex iron-sulfur subunit
MLKAVRQGAPVEKMAPKPAAPAGPKTPRKPVPAKARAAEPKAEAGTRRNFLIAALVSPFALAWIFFSGIMAAWGLALARFMMPNVLVEPPSRFNVGSPGKYAPGTVSEEYKPAYGVWLVNANVAGQQMIYALSSVCTHLGCTPGWLEGEQKFKCPCHGSGFYITGVNFEGPAPRPLERHAIRLLPDGTLEVDKSQKFQQEMGQWEDAGSFVPVA